MGNNVSDITASCKCCEEEIMEIQQVPIPMRRFDEQFQEEVCDMESRSSSWEPRFESRQSSRSTDYGSDKPSLLEALMNSDAWDMEESEDLCHLEFAITKGSELGLQLIETDEPEGDSNLVVVRIDRRSSPFARTVQDKPGVAPGDTIVKVNGKTGSACEILEMLHQASLAGSSAMSLTVQPRPFIFDVELVRDGPLIPKLGVAVAIEKTKQDCLLVTNVRNTGLVPQWNTENSGLRVYGGDLVTHVNGISRDAHSMCAAIQAAEGSTLTFRIATPVHYATRSRYRAPSPRKSKLPPCEELSLCESDAMPFREDKLLMSEEKQLEREDSISTADTENISEGSLAPATPESLRTSYVTALGTRVPLTMNAAR
mmetsp:Transcript_76609/g.132541  ORF Transcript_76609/g.132541 Transcript_76609/m.132541 type:complete len:371 (-) Transcript_76609:279-1391(-)